MADVAQQVHKMYLGDDNNIARRVKKVYKGDENNIARLVFVGGTAWNKYSVKETEHYYYVQDDLHVGTARSTIAYDWEGGQHPLAYEFNESEGFDVPSGTTVVRTPDAVGAYEVSDTSVWVIESVEPAADYGEKYYRLSGTTVASASQELDRIDYSKGSTSYGTIYAEEGQQPEAGAILEQGANYYIIRTVNGNVWGNTYYYELNTEA